MLQNYVVKVTVTGIPDLAKGTIYGGGGNLDQITMKFPFPSLNSVLLGESVCSLYLCVHIRFYAHSQYDGSWSSLTLLQYTLALNSSVSRVLSTGWFFYAQGSISFPMLQVGGVVVTGNKKLKSTLLKKCSRREFSF